LNHIIKVQLREANMTKKIICILVGMLFIATVPAITGATHNTIANDVSPNTGNINQNQNLAMWDLQFSFAPETGSGSVYEAGCEFDGTYFYAPDYNGPNFYQFDIGGNYITSFTITGVSSIRDLAYDGQYFYGGANAATIYQMDFATHTLIGTINAPDAVRDIAYDSTNDGFWIGNWATDIYLVGRDGTVIQTIPNPGLSSMYGFAYDPISTGGPFLWIFDQVDGTQQMINQLDIASGELTGVTHNVEDDLGNAGIAGGMFLTTDFVVGKLTLGGLSQASPDTIFCYDIGDVSANHPPAVPAAPTGPDTGVTNLDYTFTATTTDPDGDNVSFMFDWGDGTFSPWVGPYASGGTGSAQHAWTAAGTFAVKVKAKDTFGAESTWSAAHSIVITEAPVLKVQNITGGLFKVKSSIKNIGGVAASGINWTIELTGGAIIGKKSTGNILSLAPGDERAITSKFIFGFGKTVIKVTAACPQSTDEKSVDGKILLFFIKI
jgi:hypothetical protein